MADKGKVRDKKGRYGQKKGDFKDKSRKRLRSSDKKRKQAADGKRPRRGPGLPNAMRKELDIINNMGAEEYSDAGEGSDFDGVFRNDVYEYEEAIPEEESRKNRRFDPVNNFEFELPENFEDWKVASDEEEDDDEEDNRKGDHNSDEDEAKHARMLEGVTGLPSDAFGGRKKKDFIVSEAYPESEYNPTGDILDGDGKISIDELLDPLHGKVGFSKLRKRMHQMEKKSVSTLIPLPKTDQDRLQRMAAYARSKKDITKWEPLVKRNREAPTLYFDEDVDLGFSTIGAIASEFEPRTDFEKNIASLLSKKEVVEAHREDGARLLELNKISIEDVKDRQQRLAKMRSLLFRHEMKAKRIKKIKSKTYHRILKKDRKRAAEGTTQMDPEAAKELAMKQEFKRAEERMTLKHKNNSKWAKRILQRGLDIQDDATREAIGEQLNQHAALTRKIKSMKESSSDESSDDDDISDISDTSDQDMQSKLLNKAKEKTIELLNGDEELPKSGVLSLPFMRRGLQKRKEAADEEAKLALHDYDKSLKQWDGKSLSGNNDNGGSSGRRVFGVPKRVESETNNTGKSGNYYNDSDSDNSEDKEEVILEHNQNDRSLRDADIDPDILRDELEMSHDPVLKNFGAMAEPKPKATYEIAYLASNSWKKVGRSSDTSKQPEGSANALNSEVAAQLMKHNPEIENFGAMADPEPKATYEIAYLASNSWKKVGRSSDTSEQPEGSTNALNSEVAAELMKHDLEIEEHDDSDADSGEEMVDGILSSGPKSTYELPSQAELIQRAFAADDVEEDFKEAKEAVLDEENPRPEEPVSLPGWGQWAHIQKKKGPPSWMVAEHETANKKRLEALKKRKDAHLNNVIISEKMGKKSEKLHTKTLPFPFTSKEVFEQSIRMPIGPEFNPATAVGALNRPEIVKKAGVIIKPISYEDISVHERAQTRNHNDQKQRKGKSRRQPAAAKKKAAIKV